VWHPFTHKEEAALLELATQFEMDNPHRIRLRIEFHSPLHDQVLAALDAATPPDIVISHSDQVAEYALAGSVVPLSEYIHNAKYGLGQPQQADLLPIVLQVASLSEGDTEPLGLLFNHQIVVMFYNADWLEQLEYDAPPQGWDEFSDMCTAARDSKAGLWGYAYEADGAVLVNWISGLGGTLIDHNSGQAALDCPEATAALSLLQGLIKEESAYCISESSADCADFAAGKTLFTFGSTADLAEYAEAIASEFEWSIVPMPHLTEEPCANVEGSVMSIMRTTPRQQLGAWLFVKWFARRRNALRWVQATGALPMHRSSNYAPQMEDYFQQNPQYETACRLLAHAQPEPAVPRWREVRSLLADAAATICLEATNPEDVLAAASIAAESLLTAR